MARMGWEREVELRFEVELELEAEDEGGSGVWRPGKREKRLKKVEVLGAENLVMG